MQWNSNYNVYNVWMEKRRVTECNMTEQRNGWFGRRFCSALSSSTDLVPQFHERLTVFVQGTRQGGFDDDDLMSTGTDRRRTWEMNRRRWADDDAELGDLRDLWPDSDWNSISPVVCSPSATKSPELNPFWATGRSFCFCSDWLGAHTRHVYIASVSACHWVDDATVQWQLLLRLDIW